MRGEKFIRSFKEEIARFREIIRETGDIQRPIDK